MMDVVLSQIGSYCSITENVTLFKGGGHSTNWVTTFSLRFAYNDSFDGKDKYSATKGKTKIEILISHHNLNVIQIVDWCYTDDRLKRIVGKVFSFSSFSSSVEDYLVGWKKS